MVVLLEPAMDEFQLPCVEEVDFQSVDEILGN